MPIIREPIAAGSYYPIEKEKLLKVIEVSTLKYEKEKFGEKILGAISPHVEYIYSDFYASVYSKISGGDFVIIGPNHLNIGSKFATVKEGIWKTPLGEILVDSRFASFLLEKNKFLDFDLISHNNEYSIELQIPYLQYKFGSNFKIVPILIQCDYEDLFDLCIKLGESLADFIQKEKNKWTLIATSNLSTSAKSLAEDVDNYLISSILKMNETEFFERVKESNSNVCGYYPIICLLHALKKLGAKKATLLKYAALEGITPDYTKVVGCASIIFT